MTGLFTIARKATLVATASAVLALGMPALAVAHGHHHGHHHHHHHGHGHHHHHGHGHHHHHWRWHHRRVHVFYGGGRCLFWRNECADRWGLGSPGYDRCLWRHGC